MNISLWDRNVVNVGQRSRMFYNYRFVSLEDHVRQGARNFLNKNSSDQTQQLFLIQASSLAMMKCKKRTLLNTRKEIPSNKDTNQYRNADARN